MPRTLSGKVDRRALPEMAEAASETTQDVEPRTPVEEMLAGIWMQLLPVKRVATTDNFFQLGGHSLLAAQLLAHIRDNWKVHLPLRSLFDASSLSALAGQIE